MKRRFIPFVLILVMVARWNSHTNAAAIIRAGTINDRTPFVEIPITVDLNNSTIIVDIGVGPVHGHRRY
jgi:hypothetical protein